MADPSAPIEALQNWMQAVVVHPGGVRAGESAARTHLDVSLEDVVLPTGQLDAEGHMAVYAEAYFLRLIEILETDFPALRAALGAPAFEGLCRAYVVRHPSRHYSLNVFGAKLPEFMRSEAEGLHPRGFLVELAELERVLEETFDAEEVARLDTDALLAVPGDDWPAARLVPRPTLRLCAFEHPIDVWYTAFREDDVRGFPAPEPSWLAVHRRDFRLWRHRLSREQHALLQAILAAQPLGQALETCAALPDVDPAALVASVGGWFQEWTAEGFFERVEL